MTRTGGKRKRLKIGRKSKDEYSMEESLQKGLMGQIQIKKVYTYKF